MSRRRSFYEEQGYLLVPDVLPSDEVDAVCTEMDAVAKVGSIALQFGVPLEVLAPKMRNTRFEPAGPTTNPDIPWATSVVDYVFHWLERKFLPDEGDGSGGADGKDTARSGESSGVGCPECGALLAYQEGCLVCRSCGYNKCG